MGEVFKSVIVVVTPETHPNTKSILSGLGFEVYEGEDTVISTYKTALKHTSTKGPEKIFSCDFDRILHWINTYPQELIKITKTSDRSDFLLIGRTARAFKTHPKTQIETESIADQLSSKLLGFRQTRDIISACWRLTPTLAETLLHLPTRNRYGFYAEWPIHAWQHADNPHYIEAEGLEWETPDRYREEIEKMGYETWLQSFQAPREWEKRITMLRDWIDSILTLKI